jgi:hypothetical protein
MGHFSQAASTGYGASHLADIFHRIWNIILSWHSSTGYEISYLGVIFHRIWTIILSWHFFHGIRDILLSWQFSHKIRDFLFSWRSSTGYGTFYSADILPRIRDIILSWYSSTGYGTFFTQLKFFHRIWDIVLRWHFPQDMDHYSQLTLFPRDTGHFTLLLLNYLLVLNGRTCIFKVFFTSELYTFTLKEH